MHSHHFIGSKSIKITGAIELQFPVLWYPCRGRRGKHPKSGEIRAPKRRHKKFRAGIFTIFEASVSFHRILKAAPAISTRLILFVMFLGIMKGSILCAVHEYDKSLFISMFCENKERPHLNCEGKCKLAKMQNEQSEEQAGSMLKHWQAEVLFFNEIEGQGVLPALYAEAPTCRNFAEYNPFHSSRYPGRSIKPPEPVPAYC